MPEYTGGGSRWDIPVGDWRWVGDGADRRHITIHFPRAGIAQVTVYRGEPPADEPGWGWDGNEREPTLTPSLHINKDEPDEWHGYLTEGWLVDTHGNRIQGPA